MTYRKLLTPYLAVCLSIGGFAVASEAFSEDDAGSSQKVEASEIKTGQLELRTIRTALMRLG